MRRIPHERATQTRFGPIERFILNYLHEHGGAKSTRDMIAEYKGWTWKKRYYNTRWAYKEHRRLVDAEGKEIPAKVLQRCQASFSRALRRLKEKRMVSYRPGWLWGYKPPPRWELHPGVNVLSLDENLTPETRKSNTNEGRHGFDGPLYGRDDLFYNPSEPEANGRRFVRTILYMQKKSQDKTPCRFFGNNDYTYKLTLQRILFYMKQAHKLFDLEVNLFTKVNMLTPREKEVEG